jgi:DNA-binding CsgD family transcriptional regulator
LYLQTDYGAAADQYERAYTAYRRLGDVPSAARCARMLSWIHGNILGKWAVQNGWVARACTILEPADRDTAESGWFELLSAHSEADPDVQRQRLQHALEAGRASGDPNVEFEALGWLGLTDVFAGSLDGLALLDEALAAICAGEVDELYVIEGSFCGMLWGCEIAHDVGRAQQWMRDVEEFRRRRNLPAMASFCRAHYGSILTAAGRWTEAESELMEAASLFEASETRMKVNALIRLAYLRVLQGRFEEAEQLLEGLDVHADAIHPLATLHFSRGNLPLARDLIDRGLGGSIETSNDGPLVALGVEVALAEGRADDARRGADRLTTIAGEQGGQYLCALAALTQGRVYMATGAPARGSLEEAMAGFARAEMPMELARVRLELARLHEKDRPEIAIAEAKAALESFEQLRAVRHADEAAAVLRSLGAPIRTGPKGVGALTKREAEVLQLIGAGLSNPEIGDRLYITRKTVEHHVGNVLAKLGLRNRAEAAAYAAREKTSP